MDRSVRNRAPRFEGQRQRWRPHFKAGVCGIGVWENRSIGGKGRTKSEERRAKGEERRAKSEERRAKGEGRRAKSEERRAKSEGPENHYITRHSTFDIRHSAPSLPHPHTPTPPYLLHLLLFALLLSTITLPVQAQRVEAYLSADSAAVGDRFALTLVALHGFASDPSFPDASGADSAFGDLVVLGITTAGTQLIGTGTDATRLDSVVYEVTTFALDTAIVPPLPVSFESDAAITSDSLFLPMISLVPADAEAIQDLAPLVDFGGPIWPYVLLALALLTGLGLLWYYLRQRKQAPEPEPPPPAPEPQISPYEAALARLRQLEATNLDTAGEIKPYFVELSDALRTYLEDGLGVPALERTTRELMHEFEHQQVRHKLPGGAPQRVHGILELADLVKFAEFKPPLTQSQMILGETRKTVDVIEAKLRQIARDQERLAPRVHVEPATAAADATEEVP